LLIVVYVVIA
jgi:hypothetical protein